jgi:hypothetical protein
LYRSFSTDLTADGELELNLILVEEDKGREVRIENPELTIP